ncbi:MAG: hypothetical protein LWW79_03610 [Holophagaceae bacterium]|nr:hypothetical protein [Holophagaceae bacterium]
MFLPLPIARAMPEVRQVLRWLIKLVIGFSAGLCAAQTHAWGPETKAWSKHLLTIRGASSTAKLHLEVPGGLDPNFIVPDPDHSVVGVWPFTDLRIPPTSKVFGYELASLYWAYKRWFWQGVHGSLHLRISVHQVPEPPGDLREKAVMERFLISTHESNNERIKHGRFIDPAISILPGNWVEQGGRDWYQICFRGEKANRSDFLATTALDGDHRLMVKFTFISNTGPRYGSDWEAQARGLAAKIFHTIKVEISPNVP